MSATKELEALNAKRSALLKQLAEERRNKKLLCGCGSKHPVGSMVVIQTHWYDGAYWRQGELQYLCPKKNIRNRIFGLSKDEEQNFKLRYKRMFKTVELLYRDSYFHHEEDARPFANIDFTPSDVKRLGLLEDE